MIVFPGRSGYFFDHISSVCSDNYMSDLFFKKLSLLLFNFLSDVISTKSSWGVILMDCMNGTTIVLLSDSPLCLMTSWRLFCIPFCGLYSDVNRCCCVVVGATFCVVPSVSELNWPYSCSGSKFSIFEYVLVPPCWIKRGMKNCQFISMSPFNWFLLTNFVAIKSKKNSITLAGI